MRHIIIIICLLVPVLSISQLTTSQKSSVSSELTSTGVKVDRPLSKQQVENLFELGRIWGFLKYYHPVVARGIYSFDSCLFVALAPVLRAENMKKRDELVLQWIKTLGDENEFPTAPPVNDSNLYSQPNLKWIHDSAIFSEELVKKLDNIYRHRNAGSNYYVGPAEEGNPKFSGEASYKFVRADDDGIRILALFRYWNIIEYFFPYKHLFKDDWTNVLKEFLPQFASSRSALDYRLACWRLINRLHDTHASIYRDSIINNWTGMKGPALDFKTIDKKVVVRGYLDDSLANFEVVKPGDEILTVGGRPVSEIRKHFDPYICASNPAAADRNFLWRFLFFSNNDSLIITYDRDGSVKKGVMHLYYRPPFQNGDTWRRPMYQLLADDIGYINIGKIQTDSLPPIFKKFENTKGIIIDIRNYPNEFMPYAMGRYLKPDSTPFSKYTAPVYNYPGAFRLVGTTKNGAGSKDSIPIYKGVVLILVNEQTQSSAEYTAMALRTAPHAIVMGSQTAGADGDVSYVPFPGGFRSPFSGLGIFYPDGKDTQGAGIVPDIFVDPTRKGIADGRDEVLERAVDYIRKAKAF